MSRLKFFIPVIIFVLVGVPLYFVDNKNSTILPSVLVGKPFPAFALPSVELPVKTITEKDITGEYALVNVWGTWCINCRIEHPYLMELKNRGVKIIGINSNDEDQAAAREWLAKLGNPAVFNIADIDNTLGIDLGVYGAPETFLINPNGEILYRHVGEMNERVWQNEFLPKMDNAIADKTELSQTEANQIDE